MTESPTASVVGSTFRGSARTEREEERNAETQMANQDRDSQASSLAFGCPLAGQANEPSDCGSIDTLGRSAAAAPFLVDLWYWNPYKESLMLN